jgi:DNA-binding XRE family transcriptional regulator
MNIRDYRKRNGMTQAAFAKAVGCTQGMVHALEARGVRPGFRLASRIHVFTGGEVSRESLRPDIYRPTHSMDLGPA